MSRVVGWGLLVLAGCAGAPCETDGPSTTTVTGWFVVETGVNGLAVVSVAGGRGWAAGDVGAAFTDDGGESWRSQSLGEVTDLHFDGTKAWFSDGAGVARLDSSDTSPIGVTDAPVARIDGRADLFVAAGDTRCESTDGTVWRCEAGTSLGATDVFVGEVGAWIGTADRIWARLSGVWTEVAVGAPVAAVAFGAKPDAAPDARGLAILDDGAVLTSTDGGASWTPVVGASVPGTRDLAVSDGVWWAVGDAGNMLRSTDDGATWIPLADGAGPLVSVDTFEDTTMPNTQIVAVGADGAALVYGTHEVEDTGVDWGDCL